MPVVEGFSTALAGAGVFVGAAAGAGAGVTAGFGDGAGAAAGVEAAAYQVSIPLWPRHAPCFVAAVVKVPSLHFPVVPAGAPAGACANSAEEISSDPKIAAYANLDFMQYHPSFFKVEQLNGAACAQHGTAPDPRSH